MIFGEVPPPSEARELLAWWSDILGVLGFFVSVAGFAVAVIVRRQVREVKEQARKSQRLIALGQFAADAIHAKQSLELGREACLAKKWDRAKTHFDIAIGLLVRLSAMSNFPEELRPQLVERAVEIRDCSKWMVNRTTQQANLSAGRQAILDRLIERLVELDSKIRNAVLEGMR